jgi:hypothetical protein
LEVEILGVLALEILLIIVVELLALLSSICIETTTQIKVEYLLNCIAKKMNTTDPGLKFTHIGSDFFLGFLT